MRILALDWGTVRVGLAISDPEGRMAFPLKDPINANGAIEEIKKICAENEVEKIILGIPYSLKGQDNQSTGAANSFKEKLVGAIGLQIEVLDERFTSVAAEKLLDSQGVSQKDQRTIKDNIAAQIILQNYLDKNNN